MRGLSARLLQRLRAAGRRGRRLRRQPRRLHLRRDLPRGRRHRRARRPIGGPPAAPRHRARGGHARRLPRQVRALPLRPGAAQAARAHSRWSRSGTTTRSRTTTPAAPGRRPAAGQRFTSARQRAAYQAFFEAMPLFAPGRNRIYRTAALRPQRRPVHARRAPVPRRPAVRRRDRAAVRRSSARRAPSSGARQMAALKGRLRGSPRPGRSSATQVAIMPMKVGADLLRRSTPGRATRASARTCSPTSATADQGRRLRHRRLPHVPRRRRPHGQSGAARRSRPSSSAARSPRSSLGETTSRRRRRHSRATTPTRTRPRRSSIVPRRQPVDRPADFDHHGYGIVDGQRRRASTSAQRVQTIKRRSTATLPTTGSATARPRRRRRSRARTARR